MDRREGEKPDSLVDHGNIHGSRGHETLRFGTVTAVVMLGQE
jgi:hypothetical protein